MNPLHYYNEFEPFAVRWLRNLVEAGAVSAHAEGIVDDRSITEVTPDELRHATQAHFFAGIGVWSYALDLVGWPSGLPVWTGSCPCQPFSVAGRRLGEDDERHLWPRWAALIAELRPPVVFGEQVASPDGRQWLGNVQAELEAMGYLVAASDLCAAGVGAPHQRQRLFFGAVRRDAVEWLADSVRPRLERHARNVDDGDEPGRLDAQAARPVASCGDADGLGHTHGSGAERNSGGPAAAQSGDAGSRSPAGGERDPVVAPGATRGLADADDAGLERVGVLRGEGRSDRGVPAQAPWRGATRGAWGSADWLYCRDGKWRPVEPGTQPLVDGSAYGMVDLGPDAGRMNARKGQLKCYGNAIVPQVAAEFILGFCDAVADVAGGLR